MYKCISCGKEIMKTKMKTIKKIQCTYCGYRIIEKSRPKIIKKLKVR